MIVKSINLKDEYPNLKGGELKCCLMEEPFDNKTDWKRPAVLIAAGGAYEFVSKREQEPTLSYFLYKGYQVFTLDYLVVKDDVAYPEQLLEIAASIDYIKKNALDFRVNPQEVFAVGFSAGGHLVANIGVDYELAASLFDEKIDSKPTAIGLAYPVISYEIGHRITYRSLLKGYSDEEKEELALRVSLEKRVTKDTVPTFIWTTAQDQIVNPENSLMLATMLARNKVPYELHIYPEGLHGLSICNEEVCEPNSFLTKNATWLDHCNDFFRLYIKERY